MTDTHSQNMKALKFHREFLKRDTIYLFDISDDTGVNGFTSSDDAQILDYLNQHNGKRNLYWQVNNPRDDAPRNVKLKKEHIATIEFIFIDIDPIKDKPFDEERQRVKAFADQLNTSKYPPTFIIDSGGGYQAFWRLDQPIDAPTYMDEIEAIGRGLAVKFNTDPVQNIDRIMRLPYTLNVGSSRKQGRPQLPATVSHVSGRRYTLDTIRQFCTPIYETKQEIDYDVNIPNYSDTLPPQLAHYWEHIKNTDPVIKTLYTSKLKTRSEYDLKLCSRLKELSIPLEDAARILYIFELGKAAELSKREITRTYTNARNRILECRLPDDIIKRIDAQPNPIKQGGLVLEDDTIIEKPKRLIAVNAVDMDYLNDVDWLFDEFLMKHGFNVVYGQSGTGKSFTMLDIAVHLATGNQWGEFECIGKMPVLYVAAEAGKSFGKRVKAARSRLSVPDDASLNEFPFRVIPMSCDLMSKPTEIRDDINDVIINGRMLLRESGHDELGMVIFDTLSTTFAGGNENSSEDMGLYQTNVKHIQETLETSTTIVHHAGKDQSAGARGHSLLRAATDTEIEVRAEKKGDKWKRSLEVKKQRESEDGYTTPFGLNKVEVGKNKRGKSVTTCHLVLEGDVEFKSILPSAYDELNEGQKAMYNAIRVCDHIGHRTTEHVNGWYKHFMEDKESCYESAIKTVQVGLGHPPLTAASFGTRKSTLYSNRTSLVEKGLVEERYKNQWFIK